MRILGLDPSLCKTGWGVLEQHDDKLTCLGYGVIIPKLNASTSERLAYLALELQSVLSIHNPHLISIEETFCGINPLTNIRLGFASGALLAICGMAGSPVYQYATRLVKQMVGETGKASKVLIQEKVMSILNMDKTRYLDSTDALAVAITHTILNPVQTAGKPNILSL